MRYKNFLIRQARALFFDVDGTLTDKTGKIPNENIMAVKELARHSLIFLATSLPYDYAKRTCADIWDCISGGAFAEGSDIRIFNRGFKKIVHLNENAVKILSADAEYSCYREGGILHKIAVISGDVHDCPDFNIVHDEIIGIISKNADKLSGILCICEELKLLYDNVIVVGNSKNDVPMLKFFSYSVAVPESDISAKSAARAICGVGEIKFL